MCHAQDGSEDFAYRGEVLASPLTDDFACGTHIAFAYKVDIIAHIDFDRAGGGA